MPISTIPQPSPIRNIVGIFLLMLLSSLVLVRQFHTTQRRATLDRGHGRLRVEKLAELSIECALRWSRPADVRSLLQKLLLQVWAIIFGICRKTRRFWFRVVGGGPFSWPCGLGCSARNCLLIPVRPASCGILAPRPCRGWVR